MAFDLVGHGNMRSVAASITSSTNIIALAVNN